MYCLLLKSFLLFPFTVGTKMEKERKDERKMYIHERNSVPLTFNANFCASGFFLPRVLLYRKAKVLDYCDQ